MDYDNKCALDVALEKDLDELIIKRLVMLNLPFKIDENNEIKEVDPIDHNYGMNNNYYCYYYYDCVIIILLFIFYY